MIRQVTFKNFYSFKDEQTISFLSKKKETHDYFLSKSGDYINKIAGFVGGNASGKTNIMRLFSFISYFVCQSSKTENAPSLDVGFKTFFNNSLPSNFSLEFELDNNIFLYEFQIQNKKINIEKLSAKKIGSKKRITNLFTREDEKIKLNDEYFDGLSTKFIKNIRPDISFIAFLKAHYNIKIINLIFKYFSGIKTNINEKGELNNMVFQFKAIETYLQDPDFTKDMIDFIRQFDLGLHSFDITREINNEKNTTIRIQGEHKVGEETKKLDFNYESRGTQSLFFTLANIFMALKNNNFVVIDEIEAGLHPEALNKLISYFIEKNAKTTAQLIFSSHSLGFMNKFDMHQLYLVNKDQNNKSLVYRLNQVENIRSDENFLNKYMSGAYGGFPKIRI